MVGVQEDGSTGAWDAKILRRPTPVMRLQTSVTDAMLRLPSGTAVTREITVARSVRTEENKPQTP